MYFGFMTEKKNPHKLTKMEPVPVVFSKFNGGQIIRDEGVAIGLSPSLLGVLLSDGTKAYFRRKNGWGVGKSKFWRLVYFERDKYVHGQEKQGVEYKFKKV